MGIETIDKTYVEKDSNDTYVIVTPTNKFYYATKEGSWDASLTSMYSYF